MPPAYLLLGVVFPIVVMPVAHIQVGSRIRANIRFPALYVHIFAR